MAKKAQSYNACSLRQIGGTFEDEIQLQADSAGNALGSKMMRRFYEYEARKNALIHMANRIGISCQCRYTTPKGVDQKCACMPMSEVFKGTGRRPKRK